MSHSDRIPDTHAEAWSLLPFLVNGRIAPEDREWVEQHVQSCEECKRELEEQRPLASEMRDTELPAGFSEQRAFARLWTRIEASEGALPEESSAGTGVARIGTRRTVRWLAAAVLVQAIGLALLGVTVLNNSETGSSDFRTVTSAQPLVAAAAVRIVFTDETSMAHVIELLASYDLQLVAGPGSAGVFTATVQNSARERSVETIAESLRNNPHIQFAEPVER